MVLAGVRPPRGRDDQAPGERWPEANLTESELVEAIGDAHRHGPEHLERMAALGVSPSFLMNHLYYWGRVFRDDIFGPDRAARLDPVASAIRHGLRPSFHSDYSVSPMGGLRHVQTAVTRKMFDGGDVLNEAECVDVEAALRGVTIDAAGQTHADDRLGSLRVGKYADPAILSEDPRQVDHDQIAGITVSETRLAGVTVWSS